MLRYGEIDRNTTLEQLRLHTTDLMISRFLSATNVYHHEMATGLIEAANKVAQVESGSFQTATFKRRAQSFLVEEYPHV